MEIIEEVLWIKITEKKKNVYIWDWKFVGVYIDFLGKCSELMSFLFLLRLWQTRINGIQFDER